MTFVDDPSTGEPFEVVRRDMTEEEAAEAVAYSPFTGEPLEPEESTGLGVEGIEREE